MPGENIVLNWVVFIGECLLIALGIVLLCFVFRWVWALIKRLRAGHKLKKAACANGYSVERRGLRYLSLGKRKAETAFVLTRGECVYHVHFIPSGGKNSTLRFLDRDAYIREKEFGFVALNTNNPFSLSTARMFKPRNASGSTLQWMHTDSAAYPSGTICLEGLEDAETNRQQGVHEIVILNPAPLKAFTLTGSTWTPVIGGEVAFGVAYHDMASFCSLLARSAA